MGTLIPWCTRVLFAVFFGLTSGSAGGGRKEGKRERGDGAVTSQGGREIKVDVERRETERGAPTEQKRKIKKREMKPVKW